MNNIEIFVNRLKKLGITVELISNYPWVYLYKVNGKEVTSKFYSDHRFTVFFSVLKGGYRITDISTLFKVIRSEL
jgi:5-enolpyruvylshikimate-3-phosphate synthase